MKTDRTVYRPRRSSKRQPSIQRGLFDGITDAMCAAAQFQRGDVVYGWVHPSHGPFLIYGVVTNRRAIIADADPTGVKVFGEGMIYTVLAGNGKTVDTSGFWMVKEADMTLLIRRPDALKQHADSTWQGGINWSTYHQAFFGPAVPPSRLYRLWDEAYRLVNGLDGRRHKNPIARRAAAAKGARLIPRATARRDRRLAAYLEERKQI
jgi:hypothetical protein